jgi:hypothetical protein
MKRTSSGICAGSMETVMASGEDGRGVTATPTVRVLAAHGETR